MRSYLVAERTRVRRNTAMFGAIDGVFEGEVTPRNDQDETLLDQLVLLGLAEPVEPSAPARKKEK